MISDSVGFDFKQELVSKEVGAACKMRPPTDTVPGTTALHSMQFFAVNCKDAAVLGCPIAASRARPSKPLAAPGGAGFPLVLPIIVHFAAEGYDVVLVGVKPWVCKPGG
jgi:hypothetical protein